MNGMELESVDEYDKTKQVLSEALARARFFDSSVDGRFGESYKSLSSHNHFDSGSKSRQNGIFGKQTAIFLIADIIGLAVLVCLVSFFLF